MHLALIGRLMPQCPAQRLIIDSYMHMLLAFGLSKGHGSVRLFRECMRKRKLYIIRLQE